MTRNLSLMMILSIFLISFSAFAQRTTMITERVQQTYVNYYGVSLTQWLRVHPADVYDTEVRELYIRGTSYANNAGNIEVFVNGRLISRASYGRFSTEAPMIFPIGTRLSQIVLRVNGEVFVESVRALVIERRFVPAPIPPRPIPVPIPPRPAPIPPRPVPPRHEPAPRPAPPRHEPAPRPAPPRHEPAPRPTPPRQGPAPRPAPRPGNPGPGPRR